MLIKEDKSFTLFEIDIIRILERYLYDYHGIPADAIKSIVRTDDTYVITLNTVETKVVVFKNPIKKFFNDGKSTG